MIKILFLIISSAILFLAVNTFLCSPEGIAPEIIEVTDIKILKLNSDSLELDISLLTLNKNNSDIGIENIYLNLVFEKDTIGTAFRKEKIELKSLDTSTVNFIANLSTLKAIEIASNKKDTIDLNMKGKVASDLGLITMPVEVDLNHKFDLRKALTETIEKDTKNNKLIKVQSAKLNSLSLGKSTVEVEFKLTNPYGIDILLKNYPSQIFINENKSGEGNISSEIKLQKENAAAVGSVIYELSNTNTISSLFGSILKRKLEYRTSGVIKIEISGYDIQFPFNFKGELVKI
jgi:LEA14-like dessication related protein